jgi:hypothetical protein
MQKEQKQPGPMIHEIVPAEAAAASALEPLPGPRHDSQPEAGK